jgi:hypothetical protein
MHRFGAVSVTDQPAFCKVLPPVGSVFGLSDKDGVFGVERVVLGEPQILGVPNAVMAAGEGKKWEGFEAELAERGCGSREYVRRQTSLRSAVRVCRAPGVFLARSLSA